mmetsp:Transcript_18639/g.22041  ORF Transcript_18639/g.22041 Transcript_18639/m.22041 type:complete len:90 (-) Transcript_18639:952-1221(-)
MVAYFTKHAEEIFEPKRVLTDKDWLHKYREADQYFDSYRLSNSSIRWISPKQNKIYLFVPDESFTEDQIAAFKLYTTAFFHGVGGVEII